MFRIYPSGPEFLQDNRELLEQKPLQTAFFFRDGAPLVYAEDSLQGFAVKAEQDGKALLALRLQNNPMLLFGERELCGQLAEGMAEHRLLFRQILADRDLGTYFLLHYYPLRPGDFGMTRFLTILRWGGGDPAEIPQGESEPAQPQDAPALAALAAQFHWEALAEQPDWIQLRAALARQLPRYRLIRRQGRPVSMAKRGLELPKLCAIASVYTDPAFRRQGLARQTVSDLTREILLEGKLPYLHADIRNPAAQRLYRQIGYRADSTQGEFLYTPYRRQR